VEMEATEATEPVEAMEAMEVMEAVEEAQARPLSEPSWEELLVASWSLP